MLNMIPKPQASQMREGTVRLEGGVRWFAEEGLAEAARFLESRLNDALKEPAQKVKTRDQAKILFLREETLLEEAYRIEADHEGVRVFASAHAGALFAAQSLRQILNTDLLRAVRGLTMPACRIEDAPRFSWRGLMLDESRHFFGAAEVKKLLDMMSLLKLNRFHWHLTDDNGWRVEIKKYPLLIEIGSKRSDTHINGWRSADREGKPHSGHYTQEEIREIVAYAKALGIEVIPEIDMPAHFRAAIAAYPYLACREVESEVPWYFATPEAVPNSKAEYARIACAGKDSTLRFLFDVIDELCTLFPAPYFHIGGDEAPKDEWDKCPECEKRRKEHGLQNSEQLQGWLNNQVNDYLKTKGKRLIVWNDALRNDLGDTSIIGQYFTNQREEMTEAHVKRGGSLIVSKFKGFYYDMTYAEVTLKSAYNYPATFDGLGPEDEKNILGFEGTLWTEWIADIEKLEMNLFPRVHAMAENAWTKDGKNFKDFKKRWNAFKPVMKALGYHYAEDGVANPNIFQLGKRIRSFYGRDQYCEVTLNRNLQKGKE